MSDTEEIIPAATLVVFRDAADAGSPPELLMVERAKAMRFAAGALVFPGGRVDAGDHALATRFVGDKDEIAAKIAAVRETLEETGLAIGISPTLGTASLLHIRNRLHAGDDFAELLDVCWPDGGPRSPYRLRSLVAFGEPSSRVRHPLLPRRTTAWQPGSGGRRDRE